jgi:hypothetical protein
VDSRKKPSLQRTCLLHTKNLSPVKRKNPLCFSFIMIAEKTASFIFFQYAPWFFISTNQQHRIRTKPLGIHKLLLLSAGAPA